MLAPDGRPTFARRVGTADVLDNHRLLPSVFLLCLLLAGLVSVLFVISAINYSVLAWMGRGEAAERTIRRAAERRLKDSIADLDFAETRDAFESLLRATGRWILVGILGVIDVLTLAVL